MTQQRKQKKKVDYRRLGTAILAGLLAVLMLLGLVSGLFLY